MAVLLSAPEFVAWLGLGEADGERRPAITMLDVRRFLTDRDYVDAGRFLLGARLFHADRPEVVDVLGLSHAVVHQADVALVLYRDGTNAMQIFIFAAEGTFVRVELLAEGFRIETGGPEVVHEPMEELSRDLEFDDRIFVTLADAEHTSAGVAWSQGLLRVLDEGVWHEGGDLVMTEVSGYMASLLDPSVVN